MSSPSETPMRDWTLAQSAAREAAIGGTDSRPRIMAGLANPEQRKIVLSLVIDGKMRDHDVSRSTAAALAKAIIDALKA